MRGSIPGLASSVPFITRLPAIMQEDDFLQRMLPAFDDAIAPVLGVLDNLDAYLDPHLAPEDHLDWLATWVDIRVDQAWSVQQRRDIVAGAVALHRRTGTPGGITDAVRLAAGPESTVSVDESGGTTWSSTPGAALPGRDDPGVTVTVTVPDASIDGLQARLTRVVRTLVPAHIPCSVHLRGAKDGGA